MRVRRTQDRGVEGAGTNAEIVDEVAASCQKRRIFDARDRPPDPKRAGLTIGRGLAGGFRHPERSPAQRNCLRKNYSAALLSRNIGRSRNLPSRLIVGGVRRSINSQDGKRGGTRAGR